MVVTRAGRPPGRAGGIDGDHAGACGNAADAGDAQIQPGSERPGDLILTDSYLGPTRVGHVVIVLDSARQSTIEAANSHVGVVDGRYERHGHSIFEVWRPDRLPT